jgi:phosphatidate phosphatase LPIN
VGQEGARPPPASETLACADVAKVEFVVNDVKQSFPMKLGEGGEAFFVFETTENIPAGMQTSPLASPASSPEPQPAGMTPSIEFPEPTHLDLDDTQRGRPRAESAEPPSLERRALSHTGGHANMNRENWMLTGTGELTPRAGSPELANQRPVSGDWSGLPPTFGRSVTDEALLPSAKEAIAHTFDKAYSMPPDDNAPPGSTSRSTSPPPVSVDEAVQRARNLSKKLWGSKIPAQVTASGDLMLDMTGYKSSEEDALKAELIARKILADELEGNYDIGALIGADENGNVWIYSSEEAKEAADRKANLSSLNAAAMRSTDAISDPGYHSDDGQSDSEVQAARKLSTAHFRRDSDSAVGMTTPPDSPSPSGENSGELTKNYAKTLRLSSDQLKALNLRPGANIMSFTVNRSTCQASMYLWRHDVPIVISDIDGTITK